MIVRTIGDFHYLVRQQEHARQSGVITASLRPEFLGSMEQQVHIVRATARHDEGWGAWDCSPAVHANGLPVAFTEMERRDHLEIWRNTIFNLLAELGPVPTLFLVRHAMAITSHPDKQEEHPDYAFGDLLPTLRKRAWPELADEDADFLVEQGFSALAFGDALSLIAVAGWEERLKLTLLKDDRTPVEIEAWRDGEWRVRVDPWPFAPPALRKVHVDAVFVPAGQEEASAALVKDPRTHLVRPPVEYLPAE
jgi:hypothetical protein